MADDMETQSLEDRWKALHGYPASVPTGLPPSTPPSLMEQAAVADVPTQNGQRAVLTPPVAPPAAMGKPPIAPPPGEWQSSTGHMPAGTGAGPQLSPLPPKQPTAQPHPPALTAEHPQIQALGARAKEMLDTQGQLDMKQLEFDAAQINADNAQKEVVLKNMRDLHDHIQVSQALGAQAAKDASGDDYWANASTGMKVLRILGGVLTLGASEHGIRAAINRKVAADEHDLKSEDNTFAQMLQLGKTREQAASIDLVKQGHIFAQGIDQIVAKHPNLGPELHAKAAAMTAEIRKNQSDALAGFYKQQQDNAAKTFGNDTERMNAITQRKRLEMEGKGGASLEQVKYNDATTFKKLDGTLGQARTPDEAKAINVRTNAFHEVQRAVTKIVGIGSMGDTKGRDSELTFGHSVAGQNKKLIEDQAKAIDTAVAQMKDGGMKLSTRNEELVREFHDPNAWTTMDSTTVRELNELVAGLRQDMIQSYGQAQR